MTMFNCRLFLVFLFVLVPALGCPDPPDLQQKLFNVLQELITAKSDYQCVFDIIEEQCPCVGVPGDPDCFETSVLDINSTLCDLITNLTELTDEQPDECPPLEGCAALVGGCNSSSIAVVDPVGTILPNVGTNGSVSALTVSGFSAVSYHISYINSSPPTVYLLSMPSGDEKNFSSPLDGEVTGMGLLNGSYYIAMEDSAGNDVIYKFGFQVLFNISCAGQLRVYDGRVYFSDCKEILCYNETSGDRETKMKFPTDIKSFDVIDNDTIVFCDVVGGVWIYNLETKCFKLLDCNVDGPCCDVKINRCSWLIYVAYPDDPVLDIFNHTTCEEAGMLTYTTSTAKECPRLAFRPPCL